MTGRVSAPATGLVLAISAWSLSPLLIFESRGLADAPILALYAVALGSGLTWLALLFTGRLKLGSIARMEKRGPWLAEAFLVGLGAFVAYPLFYFSAIQSGPPVAVNLVNYLWPVVAVVTVSIWRPAGRSLETALAAGFGFAGAGLAIAAGVGVGSVSSHVAVYPFVLAGLGALTYGVTSGAISIRHPTDRADSLSLFTVALLLGGAVACLIIAGLSLVRPDLVAIHLSGHHLWALLAYSILLPVAHLSWMTAVREPKVPAFSAAFLVPVVSTGILTLVLTGVAKPEVLSALVLVLCGITFASAREKGVPVGYAVSLAFLASVQISQVLAGRVSGQVDNQIYTLSELIAAIVAVFAGVVLSNAIQRDTALQSSCSRFYGRAWSLIQAQPVASVLPELNRLDALVLHGNRPPAPERTASGERGDDRFATEWVDVEVAVGNGVSDYEWLVLMVGGSGLLVALHAYAVDSVSVVTVLLRAFAVALIVGVLFAIRDYDHHRPRRLCKLLTAFRGRYGIPIEPGSPLSVGVEYWTEDAPYAVRVGLAALVVVAIGAVTLNA
jgi:drug/metabolite transporter (DMT)-like permease